MMATNDKMEEIMKKYKLFWQYPVITEQTFYNQAKGKKNYLGFPWATILDRNYHPRVIFTILAHHIDVNKDHITCCQHIRFRALIPLFRALVPTATFCAPVVILAAANLPTTTLY